MKYCILHSKGGLGKHIATTAVAYAIKKAYPDRNLIIVSPWHEVFDNLDFVYKTFDCNKTQYFYYDYVKDKDSIIFAQDPYKSSEYINGKHLIQSWIESIGLTYNNEQPTIKFDAETLLKSNALWYQYGTRPYMVLQTNGGFYNTNLPWTWDRDIPADIAQQIVNRYKDSYHIYHITTQNGYPLHGVERVNWQDDYKLFLSILKYSHKRVLIDSALQHASAAMNLPSVVLWNLNKPSSLGYDVNINIKSQIPLHYKNRNAILLDETCENDPPCPYENFENLFDMKTVFDAVDKL